MFRCVFFLSSAGVCGAGEAADERAAGMFTLSMRAPAEGAGFFSLQRTSLERWARAALRRALPPLTAHSPHGSPLVDPGARDP